MKAALLISTGSPDSYTEHDVKVYLRQFLTDRYILDMPFLLRWALVEGFILRKRPKHSAQAYRRIWTSEGSPLIVHTRSLCQKLNQVSKVPVYFAMRYGSHSIASVLQKMQSEKLTEIFVIILFAQYADATYLSAQEQVLNFTKMNPTVKVTFKEPFFEDENYLDAVAVQIKQFNILTYDQVVFSYHSLPISQIKRTDTHNNCLKSNNCCEKVSASSPKCYRYQTLRTSRLLAEKLNLPQDKYRVCYSSRFNNAKWLEPFYNRFIESAPSLGFKRILTVLPGFCADNLETLEEIGMGEKEKFTEKGGLQFDLVPSLNDSNKWVSTLLKWIDSFSSTQDNRTNDR